TGLGIKKGMFFLLFGYAVMVQRVDGLETRLLDGNPPPFMRILPGYARCSDCTRVCSLRCSCDDLCHRCLGSRLVAV
ncbi:hypothetical protein V8C37DRAFT_384604, partial [Trichoderma ceciliae]